MTSLAPTHLLTQRLHAQAMVDSNDEPDEILDLLSVSAFVEGDQPFARAAGASRCETTCTGVCEGGRVLRTVVSGASRYLLVCGPGWTMRVRVRQDGDIWAWIFGANEALVDRLVAEIKGWGRPPEIVEGTVDVSFVYRADRCVARHRRRIDAPAWAEIRHNYGADVSGALDALVGLEPAQLSGRLALLHGPPGTGKTTLLRMLARAWAQWCETVYIVDPDQLFSNAGYLHTVLLGDDGGLESSERWKLLVLEDCDELIRPDAKHASGQALSRLLNLTDGMVGQGLRTLVCLTTNEPLWRLHPAVTRPGRCIAQVEVGRLTLGEAAAWLGDHPAVSRLERCFGPDGATLAELFALRDGHELPDVSRSTGKVGQYL